MHVLHTITAFAITPLFFVSKAAATTQIADSGLRQNSRIDVSDRYIITLRPGVDFDRHMAHLNLLHAEANKEGWNFEGVSHQYNISDFQAYAGHFNASVIRQLEGRNDVKIITSDKIMTIGAIEREQHQDARTSCGSRRRSMTRQCNADWGLHAVSHKKKKSVGPSVYVRDSSDARGTYAYVVDSGIDTAHAEFESRASLGYNALRDKESFADRLGHGTFVAGLIGSKTYGSAKKCNLIAVKVLESESGWTSEAVFLDGYRWAANDIVRKNRAAKSVINVSLTTYQDNTINAAVDGAYSLGITTVTSSGNFFTDASHFSPGSAKGAITVSATDKNYKRIEEACTGPTVAIFGPGGGVKSTWIGGRRATATKSGTSYAAAYVSGLILYFKGLHNLPDARQTKQYLLRTATPGLVGDTAGSPNLFAYNGNGA
ncbi:subtilisin-like protein [Myriangium duriaei CBS 260.36]|uniref:Subtilisin-like protein n=1 Tax=Myriangium duriaei CBS 260.36 TaxID=1168546 RepID=A0A9P4J7N4_9PEZI|nr:subtilisin-like protein [Myriangium duriaei CBS 260.36]